MGLFDRSVKIKVARLDERAELPKKNHTNKFADAAYDLFVFDTTLPLNPLSAVYAPDAEKKTIDTLVYESPIEVTLANLVAKKDSILRLGAGQRKLVGTGIRLAIPDGYWVKFHERSGLANKGIHVLGGVIDSGYTGELKVIVYNSGHDAYEHDCNKAIAQFTVEKVTKSDLELISVEDMDLQATYRERQSKGFGSSDGK